MPQGTAHDIQPALQQRARVLSDHLDREIVSALTELGEKAATAYLSIAEKSAGGYLQRLVGRIMRALNVQAWIEERLRPLLRNHASRVATDLQRVVQAEIGLQVGVDEDGMKSISDSAGQHLGMRDIEPQVRQAILSAIRQGIAAGDNPLKTAQRIRSLVPAGRFVKVGPRYRAQLIAREENAQIMRASILALYASNPNVTHLRLRDGIYGPPRSDSECIARDGEIVPITDPPVPYHILCTLSYDPVVTNS